MLSHWRCWKLSWLSTINHHHHHHYHHEQQHYNHHYHHHDHHQQQQEVRPTCVVTLERQEVALAVNYQQSPPPPPTLQTPLPPPPPATITTTRGQAYVCCHTVEAGSCPGCQLSTITTTTTNTTNTTTTTTTSNNNNNKRSGLRVLSHCRGRKLPWLSTINYHHHHHQHYNYHHHHQQQQQQEEVRPYVCCHTGEAGSCPDCHTWRTTVRDRPPWRSWKTSSSARIASCSPSLHARQHQVTSCFVHVSHVYHVAQDIVARDKRSMCCT